MKLDRHEVARRVERFKEVARKAGVKLTLQRLEIFREIAGRLDHPSAEAIMKALRRRMPTVSLDTIYRTLWLLYDLGLISTLGARRESVRFDANPVPHHHYICLRCGLVRDFESPKLDVLPIPDSVKELGSTSQTYVEVHGVCKRCQEISTESKKES